MKTMPADLMRVAPRTPHRDAAEAKAPHAEAAETPEAFRSELRRAAAKSEPVQPDRAEQREAERAKPKGSVEKKPAQEAKRQQEESVETPLDPIEAQTPVDSEDQHASDSPTGLAAIVTEMMAAPQVDQDAATQPVVAAAVAESQAKPVLQSPTDEPTVPIAERPAAIQPLAPPTAVVASAAVASHPVKVASPTPPREGGDKTPKAMAAEQLSADTAAPAPTSETRETPAPQPPPQRDHELLKHLQPVALQAHHETPTEDAAGDVNAARVARGLQNAVSQNGGTVTLRLTPIDLGTVRIQMQLQGTSVSAQFFTESDAANTLLNQQLSHLRSALEGQGLTVDRLQVQTMQPTNSGQMNSGGQQQHPDGAPQDGRSRGFHGGEHGRQQWANARDETRDGRRRGIFSSLLAEEQV